MFGAIIGDIVGSIYEHARPPIKTIEFDFFTERSFFTDDTVLTCAVADAILHNKDYGEMIQQYGRKYPGRGYGGRFKRWLYTDPPMPYNSFGNGSAMRVSPVGFAFDTVEDVLREAEKTALPTHNHPEAIIAFLDSTDFESAIRLAISLGGDADTLACIAGGIAQAFYGEIPQHIQEDALDRLPNSMRTVVEQFNMKYGVLL